MPKVKQFKPMKASNDEVLRIDLDGKILWIHKGLVFPYLVSTKLDGIRCIVKEGKLFSASLKPIVNKQLQEKFAGLKAYTLETGDILDGEIYSPKLTFQEITHFVMNQDLSTEKTRKNVLKDIKESKKKDDIDFWLNLPESLNLYSFDAVTNEKFSTTFAIRQKYLDAIVDKRLKDEPIVVLKQTRVNCIEDLEALFFAELAKGNEGLILRSIDGPYKLGRGTLLENFIVKMKPYHTFDSRVVGFVQSTEVDPDVEKTTNELGQSVTSKKKEDRLSIEKCSGVKVD